MDGEGDQQEQQAARPRKRRRGVTGRPADGGGSSQQAAQQEGMEMDEEMADGEQAGQEGPKPAAGFMPRFPGEHLLFADEVLGPPLAAGLKPEEEHEQLRERYSQYRRAAANKVRRLAEAKFRAVFYGEDERPALPLYLTVLSAPNRKRTLAHAAHLGGEWAKAVEQGASRRELRGLQARVERRARKYGRHVKALALDFEAMCLGAPQPEGSSPADACSAATHGYLLCYMRAMIEVFGEEMVQPAVLMPASVLELQEGSAEAWEVQRARDLCKRFIVYHDKGAWEQAQAAASALVAEGKQTPILSMAQRAAMMQQQQQQAEQQAEQQQQGGDDGAADGERPRKKQRTGGGSKQAAGSSTEAAGSSKQAAGRAEEAGSSQQAGAEQQAAARQPGLVVEKDRWGRMIVKEWREGGEEAVPVGGRLDRGLLGVNTALMEALTRVPKQPFSTVSITKLDGRELSCNMLHGEWQAGNVVKTTISSNTHLDNAFANACKPGDKLSNLYLTDATLPSGASEAFPKDAPGMCCRVDDAANAMLPRAVGTQRGTNVNCFLKNEATGVGTASAYLIPGCRATCTCWHQESFLFTSFNAGSADLVVQLLTSVEAVRLLQRLHAAVVGEFRRLAAMLPLHCYLLEGIPLVAHMRDEGFASLIEFPQGSMHAVITYGNQQDCFPPTTKIAYNDVEVRTQVVPAYFSALLASTYTRVLPEEGHPPDDADTWIDSSYIVKRPATLADEKKMREEGRFPPWREEWEAAAAAAASPETPERELEAAAPAPAAAATRRSRRFAGGTTASMDVLVVRLAEKLLDVAEGRIVHGASWSRGVPSVTQALQALADLLPVLRHLIRRAEKEQESEDGAAFLRRLPAGAPLQSQQYLERLLGRVLALGPAGLDEQLRTGRFAGSPSSKVVPRGPGSGVKAAKYAWEALHSSWVLDAYLQGTCRVRGLIESKMRAAVLRRLDADALRGHWLLACLLEFEQLEGKDWEQASEAQWRALRSRRRSRSLLERLCGEMSDQLAAPFQLGAEPEEWEEESEGEESEWEEEQEEGCSQPGGTQATEQSLGDSQAQLLMHFVQNC